MKYTFFNPFHNPTVVPAPQYNTAGRTEGGIQSLLNVAFNTFGNKAHALGLIKEALCFPGHEPATAPGRHD